ncbi:hypothetical protein OC835_000027 [Tilletia horrida]|nr:hypothetical protein OC835_000027 [Tilletia horrida]
MPEGHRGVRALQVANSIPLHTRVLNASSLFLLQASAAFPENTIASFDRAIRDGSEGLESDVHITKDNVIVMFHDPSLERTTDGKGFIRDQNYHDGIEHVRTLKEPKQQIPTFRELCDLLMKEENKHVKLNIDVKPDNDPDRLFKLMKEVVTSYPNYQTDLSPRLILGLWHTVFLRAALEHVPELARAHIGYSPWVARNFFWKDCQGFSMQFAALVTADGQAFIKEANRAGKSVYVWTVNRKDEMIEATRWGVKAILTDDTAMLHHLRKEMTDNFPKTRSESVGLFFRWSTWRYYTVPQFVLQSMWCSDVERRAGLSFKSGASRIASVREAAANGLLFSEKALLVPADEAPLAAPPAPPVVVDEKAPAPIIRPAPAAASGSLLAVQA